MTHSRPLVSAPGDRVIVGAPYGADAVNAAVHPIKAQTISGIGFDKLQKLNVPVARLVTQLLEKPKWGLQ